MRQNLTLLFVLCSFLGFSQLYVSEGTLFSLETPETLLSSQEVINQVDAPLYGRGLLFLNHSAVQQLRSTQTLLSLPSLHLANATLVRIETAVDIHNQLRIDAGVLVLDQDIHLPSKALLVLGATASTESQSGQLRFHTQLDTDTSVVWHTTPTVLKYTRPEEAPTPPSVLPRLSQASNFGYTAHGYSAHIVSATPPPKQA
jgi:hypothetical protein